MSADPVLDESRTGDDSYCCEQMGAAAMQCHLPDQCFITLPSFSHTLRFLVLLVTQWSLGLLGVDAGIQLMWAISGLSIQQSLVFST